MPARKASPAASKTRTTKQTATATKTAAGKQSDNAPKAVAKPATKKAAPAKRSATTTTRGIAKKEPAKKKTTAATMKTAPKPATTEKAATNKKRKAEDEIEEEEPKANTSKRRKGDDEPVTAAPPSKRPAAAAKKPKVIKPRVPINYAPTDRLDVYVSGEGSQGELGLGAGKGSMNALKPRLNPNLSAADVGVVQLAAGGMHCAALTHDNKILTWGVNDEGALGRDTQWEGGLVDVDDNKSDDSSEDAELNPKEATPTPAEFTDLPEGTIFTQVAAGDSTTFALTDEGQVYGWGTFRVSFRSSCPSRQY
jgi:regulator of chromosome condensation